MAVALGSGSGVSVAVTVDVLVGRTSACLVCVAVNSMVAEAIVASGSIGVELLGRLQAERINTPIVSKQKSWKKLFLRKR